LGLLTVAVALFGVLRQVGREALLDVQATEQATACGVAGHVFSVVHALQAQVLGFAAKVLRALPWAHCTDERLPNH
jgi:hypothetical protein